MRQSEIRWSVRTLISCCAACSGWGTLVGYNATSELVPAETSVAAIGYAEEHRPRGIV